MFLGQFAYIEATDREPGATFDLRLPALTSSQSSSFCLKLKYNLNGQHIGRLDVVKVLSDGSEDVMSTQSGSECACLTVLEKFASTSHFRVSFRSRRRLARPDAGLLARFERDSRPDSRSARRHICSATFRRYCHR